MAGGREVTTITAGTNAGIYTADPWLLTASGRQFYLLHPTPEMVDLYDIAHALGQIIRFNGHTRRPYTVAEHSVLVALILREQGYDPAVQLDGLFHDAAEAYIGDVPTPIKWAMDRVVEEFDYADPGTMAFRMIESRVDHAIRVKFALPPAGHRKSIKAADTIALATEARDLLPGNLHWPGELPVPYNHTLEIAMLWAQWLYTHNLEEVLPPAELFKAVFRSLTRSIYSCEYVPSASPTL